tara:strand:+ start:574 stop:1119 length:546 start_codon:yes stop_codon:yes gene_type:complete
MKLVYQIPDKLYYIQNFLDYPTYKQLHYDVFKSKDIHLNLASNSWQKELLIGFKKSPERADLIPEYNPLKKLNILLNTNPFHKINQQIKKFVLHSMTDNSGINWHDDNNYKYGITYYINRRWNPKFGGEFLFQDKNNNGFIPLVGNSIVIVKAPFDHKVTPVMDPLVPRKTIQIFLPKDNK